MVLWNFWSNFTLQESGNWKSEDLVTFWGASVELFGVISHFKSLKLQIRGPVHLFWGFRGTFGATSLFKILKIGNFWVDPWNFWVDYTFQESENGNLSALKNGRVSVSIPWSFWKVTRCRGTFGK